MAKAIIPRLRPITQARLEAAMRPAVNKVQNILEVEFRKSTKTWNRSIRFIRDEEWVASGLDIMVWSQDLIYFFISEGTRKDYPITPKKGPFLIFNTPFKSKTVPGRISSRKGGRGNIKNKRMSVRHPGVRARKFDVLVKEAVDKKVQDRIIKSFVDFIARSGH